MSGQDQKPHSQLFTLRLWREELGDDRHEWRGRIQHIQSGETYYFREWSALVALIQKIITDTEDDVEID